MMSHSDTIAALVQEQAAPVISWLATEMPASPALDALRDGHVARALKMVPSNGGTTPEGVFIPGSTDRHVRQPLRLLLQLMRAWAEVPAALLAEAVGMRGRNTSGAFIAGIRLGWEDYDVDWEPAAIREYARRMRDFRHESGTSHPVQRSLEQ